MRPLYLSKKVFFYENKIQFLRFDILAWGIKIKKKKIKVIKFLAEQKSIRDILVLLNFANFYWRFIKSFNNIVNPLILMLKVTTTLLNIKNPLKTSRKSKIKAKNMNNSRTKIFKANLIND